MQEKHIKQRQKSWQDRKDSNVGEWAHQAAEKVNQECRT